MTFQIGDTLLYRGEKYRMATEPLWDYLYPRRILFRSTLTANWRGYFATWAVKDDRLFLTDFNGHPYNEERPIAFKGTADLQYLFPGQEEVFAGWYSGRIRLPLGEIIDFVHSGYESTFEKDLFLTFEKGILIAEREVDNRGKPIKRRPRIIFNRPDREQE